MEATMAATDGGGAKVAERPLRVGRVATMIGLPYTTALRLVEAGEFPGAFRAHARGHWRIPREDVISYVERRPRATRS